MKKMQDAKSAISSSSTNSTNSRGNRGKKRPLSMNISTLLIEDDVSSGSTSSRRKTINQQDHTNPTIDVATLPTPPSEVESIPEALLLPPPLLFQPRRPMSAMTTTTGKAKQKVTTATLPPEIWTKVFDQPSTVEELAHLWVEGRRVARSWREMVEDVFKRRWVPELRIEFEDSQPSYPWRHPTPITLTFSHFYTPAPIPFAPQQTIHPPDSFAAFRPTKSRASSNPTAPPPQVTTSSSANHTPFPHQNHPPQHWQTHPLPPAQPTSNPSPPTTTQQQTQTQNLTHSLTERLKIPWCITRPRLYISLLGSVNDTELVSACVTTTTNSSGSGSGGGGSGGTGTTTSLCFDWKGTVQAFLGEEWAAQRAMLAANSSSQPTPHHHSPSPFLPPQPHRLSPQAHPFRPTITATTAKIKTEPFELESDTDIDMQIELAIERSRIKEEEEERTSSSSPPPPFHTPPHHHHQPFRPHFYPRQEEETRTTLRARRVRSLLPLRDPNSDAETRYWLIRNDEAAAVRDLWFVRRRTGVGGKVER